MINREFCDDMSSELGGWKARLYDIINHVETLPALDRQYFSPDVNTLRALISEMEDRIKDLKAECRISRGLFPEAA